MQTWLPDLPLQTILTVLEQIGPEVGAENTSGSSYAAINIVKRSELQGIERAPVRVHLFEWSPLALGWYESLLWSFIYTTEMTLLKGAPGIWSGTSVRLFRVQETAAPGPSLMSPVGAVDAVGSTLVKKFGSLNFGSSPQRAQADSPTRLVRDV